MRRTITLIILLVAAFPVQSFARPETSGETIRLLVRSDQPGPASPTGWERLEVPVEGSRNHTIMRLQAVLGRPVIVENRYPLLGPTDEPLYPGQWGLENTGQTGGSVDADIDAEQAWPVSSGAGVVVAVIDSGIDTSHPEFDGQIWTNPSEAYNGVDDDGNGKVDDVVGWDVVGMDADPTPDGVGPDEAHGTMVAGIIGAAVNGVGLTGVTPGSKLMNVRACGGGDCWSLDLAEAIHYAVDEGADIINFSIGGPGTGDMPLDEAIAYAGANNVIVVAAVGNDGKNIDVLPNGQIMIPAGFPHDNILGVAASDKYDIRAGFSNWGPVSVDLFAPGVDVRTTGTPSTALYPLGSGTSFAAPFVSGVAALLLATDPVMGYQELIARLEAFTDHPPALAGLSGSGRVNAGLALTMRFVDTQASVFVNAIDWLAGQGITQGCNPPQNHMFCPDAAVTRGEMAVFLSRAFHLPEVAFDYFSDDSGRFYEAAANRMAAAGLTVGCAPGKYCGERLISREEMAAMLSRALKLPQTGTDYFVDDTGSIFEGAINRIAEASITLGCNPPANDHFCPTANVTRGQMAAFIKRAIT